MLVFASLFLISYEGFDLQYIFESAHGAKRHIPRSGLNIALAHQPSVKVSENVN